MVHSDLIRNSNWNNPKYKEKKKYLKQLEEFDLEYALKEIQKNPDTFNQYIQLKNFIDTFPLEYSPELKHKLKEFNKFYKANYLKFINENNKKNSKTNRTYRDLFSRIDDLKTTTTGINPKKHNLKTLQNIVNEYNLLKKDIEEILRLEYLEDKELSLILKSDRYLKQKISKIEKHIAHRTSPTYRALSITGKVIGSVALIVSILEISKFTIENKDYLLKKYQELNSWVLSHKINYDFHKNYKLIDQKDYFKSMK